MTVPYRPLKAPEILDLYFIENRARLLDIASFLDRIDRHEGAEQARSDFRYQAFVKSVAALLASAAERTKAVQLLCSDTSSEPLESAVGLKAVGAWQGGNDEGN